MSANTGPLSLGAAPPDGRVLVNPRILTPSQRVQAALAARLDYALAVTCAVVGQLVGVDPWLDVEAAYERAVAAEQASHPWTMAADSGATNETDYYGGA